VISSNSKYIYLFGGYDGSAWLNDLWKFDVESARWSCIQESSDPRPDHNDKGESSLGTTVRGKVPTRRFGYVSVVHDEKLLLWGGFDGSRWLSDMYVFDFASKEWKQIIQTGKLPSPRSCPAWAKDDTHVYIQGGYDGVERKDDFFACDMSSYTWTQMPSLGTTPSPRYFHSCCLYGNKMYLYGGYSGSLRLADMFAYDFETNHWSEVNCSNGEPPSGRSSLVTQVYENSLYVFGK
jgi:N-acetylneuraminic acid mutarotase